MTLTLTFVSLAPPKNSANLQSYPRPEVGVSRGVENRLRTLVGSWGVDSSQMALGKLENLTFGGAEQCARDVSCCEYSRPPLPRDVKLPQPLPGATRIGHGGWPTNK